MQSTIRTSIDFTSVPVRIDTTEMITGKLRSGLALFSRIRDWASLSRFSGSTLIRRAETKLYMELMSPPDRANLLHTSGHVKFMDGSEISEIGARSVIRQLGRPWCRIETSDFPRVKILMHKRKLGRFKAHVECHFYLNRLFYVKYTFPYASEEDKNEIGEILSEKYGVNLPLEKRGTTLSIADQHGYIVRFQNELPCVIGYCNTRSNFFQVFSRQLDEEARDQSLRNRTQEELIREKL